MVQTQQQQGITATKKCNGGKHLTCLSHNSSIVQTAPLTPALWHNSLQHSFVTWDQCGLARTKQFHTLKHPSMQAMMLLSIPGCILADYLRLTMTGISPPPTKQSPSLKSCWSWLLNMMSCSTKQNQEGSHLLQEHWPFVQWDNGVKIKANCCKKDPGVENSTPLSWTVNY